MSGELWAKGALLTKINFDYLYRKSLIMPHGKLPRFAIFWGCLQSLQTWLSGSRSKPVSIDTQFIFCTAQNVHWTMPWRKSKRYSFEHKMVYDSLILLVTKNNWKTHYTGTDACTALIVFFIISILNDLGKNFWLWACSIRCLLRWEKPLNKGIPIRWPHVEARIECMLNPYWYRYELLVRSKCSLVISYR